MVCVCCCRWTWRVCCSKVCTQAFWSSFGPAATQWQSTTGKIRRLGPSNLVPSLFRLHTECDEFCYAVRHALVKTFVSLHDAFALEGIRTTGMQLEMWVIRNVDRDNIVGVFDV